MYVWRDHLSLAKVFTQALRLLYLRSLDRKAFLNHLHPFGWFILTYSSHIFLIFESHVWAVIGTESCLLLFLNSTLTPDLYLCHRAHYIYSYVATGSLQFTLVINIFSCDFRCCIQALIKRRKAKRRERWVHRDYVTFIFCDVHLCTDYLTCLRRLGISYLAQIPSPDSLYLMQERGEIQTSYWVSEIIFMTT